MKLINTIFKHKKRKGLGRNNSTGRGNNGQRSRAGGVKGRKVLNKLWTQVPKLSKLKPKTKPPVLTLNILKNYIGNKSDIARNYIKISDISRRYSKSYKILPSVKEYCKNVSINLIE